MPHCLGYLFWNRTSHEQQEAQSKSKNKMTSYAAELGTVPFRIDNGAEGLFQVGLPFASTS